MSEVNVVVNQPSTIKVVVQPPAEKAVQLVVGQGPAGIKGDKGEDGTGIDNFDPDPLAYYILAKS